MMMIKWCLLLKFIWVSLLCVKKKLRISIWVFWSKLHNGPFLNLGRITNWSFTVLVNLQNGPRMFRVNYWMVLLGSEFPQGMNLYCTQMNWIWIIWDMELFTKSEWLSYPSPTWGYVYLMILFDVEIDNVVKVSLETCKFKVCLYGGRPILLKRLNFGCGYICFLPYWLLLTRVFIS